MCADHSFVNTLHETSPSNILGNVSECSNVKHNDFSDARDEDTTGMKENESTGSLNRNCVLIYNW